MKSEREVAESCPTLRYPMDCTPPGSSVHGIFQARVLEWVAIALSLRRLEKDSLVCPLILGAAGEGKFLQTYINSG